MRRIAPLLALAAGLVSALAVPAADAGTLQVAAGAPDVLATDGTCSLREAIINANGDAATWPDCPAGSGADTIVLPAGTYVLAVPGTDEDAAATGDLDVLDDLTLVGARPAITTIDAAGLDRVLDVFAPASMEGLILTGGVADGNSISGSGGGIRVSSYAALSLLNTTVSGNSAALGGGLFVSLLGSIQATDVAVSGNVASVAGGGIAVEWLAEVLLTESSVSENSAGYSGGGISNQRGAVTLLNSVISANHAQSLGGGGIANWGSSLWVINSAISGNQAQSGGGGIANSGSELQILNSIISGNSAPNGGGILGVCTITGGCTTRCPCTPTTGEIQYSTVSGNSGGGISTDRDSLIVRGAIVAAQLSGQDCEGSGLSSRGYSLDSDGTCNLTDPTDLPNTDPMLGPLQDNGGPNLTHALLPGSPAIDEIPVADCTWDDDGDPGTPEVPLTKDQRGVARPQGDSCDIGASEVTACADGLDNDGDTFVDAADPGCRDAASVREDPQCQDGINNDPAQDDLIDFDGGVSALGYLAADPDPQCVGQPWKNNEFRQPSCGLGVELAFLLPLSMWLFGRRRRKPDAGEQTGAGQLSIGKEGTVAWELARVSLLGVALSMAIGVAEPIQAIDCSASQADLDLDGVVDPCDNCPPSLCAEPLDCANPVVTNFDPTTMTTTGGQLDSDGDGLGDVCDLDLPPWEVSAGNTQVSCPECPLECAGLGCPGSRAAYYPVGAVSHLGLVRACDTSVPGFADGEVTPGCHPVCDLDGDPSTPDEWCRKLDITVWYPATGGTPVGPSYSVCETGGTEDSCEALGCVWSNDYFPGYYGGPLDLRCLAAEAAVNAPLVSAASDRPLPVLFMSHGSPAGPRDHGHLAAKLAESGYVVVSVSHPGTQWFDFDFPINEGSSYQWLFSIYNSIDPATYPLLEQNPYCNATTGAIVSAMAPSLGFPNAANFSGFATKEECFANSCGVWDAATGCDADPGTLFGPPAMLLRRERGRDLSDVMTYFFGGELFDGQGLRSAPPPGGGWNESGQWPWADAWDPRAGVLDPARIGVIGYSFGGLTAITLTSKASYSGYQPAGTPDWDTQRFRDARVRAALLWAPGSLLGVPRVLAPLAVPTMIQSGVYDFVVPWSDDLPASMDCVAPDVSGTGAEDPLCSIEGLFAATQFDAPELEAQGLLAEPADPPRFLTRLDTAGHLTFSDEEVAAFEISCPADPTQPCSCLDAATEASRGLAECTQLAGDRAKAEEILLENARSFLNAFVADNPSGWTALEGDQYASDEVAGFLTADWDRDAPACGFSPLLGDGVLDSIDPEPLVCNPTLPCDDGIDNDSDGSIDFPADAGCDDLLDISEAPDPMQAEVKLRIRLKLNKPSKDKIQVKIKDWQLPAGVVPTDVIVNVGGAAFTGTLDAKGRFKSPDGRDSITMKQNKKTQLWNITVKQKNHSFAEDLWNEGCTNADNAKPGLPVTVPLTIEVGGVAYGRDMDLVYQSKFGKKGSAK